MEKFGVGLELEVLLQVQTLHLQSLTELVDGLNPFRYRGYYQDTETGLYYLMSRYYDAVTR